jgi:hypothetical protein
MASSRRLQRLTGRALKGVAKITKRNVSILAALLSAVLIAGPASRAFPRASASLVIRAAASGPE